LFGVCYLLNQKPAESYQKLIDHLNSMPPEEGWFTEHYGGLVSSGRAGSAVQEDGSKKPWQKKNTRKLDPIRREIDRLDLDEVSRCVALTSLILALDQVDNSLGHHVSYLKDWSPRSYNDLCLKVPRIWVNKTKHQVMQEDVFKVASEVDAELAYYDPPYGSNNEKMPPSRVRYSSYYHLWTTVCRNDQPEIFGKANRRVDTSDRVSGSVFEEFRRNPKGRLIAVEAIEKLLRSTTCPWVLLSYSSGGRATAEELNQVITSSGDIIQVMEIDYQKNVMASMRWTQEWLKEAEAPHREFLFLIKK
jgi:adenine-specific DNA-methyltransferase